MDQLCQQLLAATEKVWRVLKKSADNLLQH